MATPRERLWSEKGMQVRTQGKPDIQRGAEKKSLTTIEENGQRYGRKMRKSARRR